MSKKALVPVLARALFTPILTHFVFEATHYRLWALRWGFLRIWRSRWSSRNSICRLCFLHSGRCAYRSFRWGHRFLERLSLRLDFSYCRRRLLLELVNSSAPRIVDLAAIRPNSMGHLGRNFLIRIVNFIFPVKSTWFTLIIGSLRLLLPGLFWAISVVSDWVWSPSIKVPFILLLEV